MKRLLSHDQFKPSIMVLAPHMNVMMPANTDRFLFGRVLEAGGNNGMMIMRMRKQRQLCTNIMKCEEVNAGMDRMTEGEEYC